MSAHPSHQWATRRRHRIERYEEIAQSATVDHPDLPRLRRSILAATLANIAGPGPDAHTARRAESEIDFITAVIANPGRVQDRTMWAILIAWVLGLIVGGTLMWTVLT